MKRFSKLMILAIAISSGMMSCSTNAVEDEPTPVNPESETRTLNIRVVSNDFTRADESGNEINTLYLAFYKGEETTPLYIKPATKENDSFKVEISINPSNIPNKVVAFANFSDDEGMNNAITTTPSTVDVIQPDGEGYFKMSSAVYYDEEKLINYSPVISENIYGGTPIDIYLDRLAAKVTVEKEESATMPSLTVNENETLTIDIINWGLTGTDKSSYLLKQVPNTSSALIWAIKDHSLSWAKSVNHGNLTDALNINNITLEGANVSLASSTYAHETTRNEDDLKFQNSKPSIILVGKYKKNNVEIGTFYRLRSGDNNQTFTEIEFMQKVAADKGILFVKLADESIKNVELSDIENALTLSTPTIEGKKIPSFGVSPQLKSDISTIPFCNSKGVKYDKAELNALLCNRYGILEKYNDGKCIFIVPIVHNKVNNIYGLVRNHSYKLTIKSISGFGRGIADNTSEISEETIPELESTYTINSTLHVNKWTEIGQDITIPASE